MGIVAWLKPGYLRETRRMHRYVHMEYTHRTDVNGYRCPYPSRVQTSTSPPRDSMSRVRAQIRHPSPILSRRILAVVTLGPTLRDAVADRVSSTGDMARGVRSADRSRLFAPDCCGVSECKWDRWKMWPQAKPTRISRSVWGFLSALSFWMKGVGVKIIPFSRKAALQPPHLPCPGPPNFLAPLVSDI